jgi:hypothetical protein
MVFIRNGNRLTGNAFSAANFHEKLCSTPQAGAPGGRLRMKNARCR